MCECVGVGACAKLWFWVQEKKEKKIKIKDTERGERMDMKWRHYKAAQPKGKREKERKKQNSLVDGQLGADPFFPQRGCQPSLSQYNTNQYSTLYTGF